MLSSGYRLKIRIHEKGPPVPVVSEREGHFYFRELLFCALIFYKCGNSFDRSAYSMQFLKHCFLLNKKQRLITHYCAQIGIYGFQKLAVPIFQENHLFRCNLG